MKIPSSINRRRQGADSSLERQQAYLLNEAAFLRMLCLERKRAERSRRPFILMLMDLGGVSPNGRGERVLENLLRPLSQSTRETDLKGWYKQGQVIGVIFTECHTADIRSIVPVLLAKVRDALCTNPPLNHLNRLRLSFQVFPDDSASDPSGTPMDLTLYPDVVEDIEGHKLFRCIKRIIDLVGGSIALLASSPVFLAAAILIKMTSEGPILFQQPRLGQYGKRFNFLKFRSMYVDSDKSIHERFVKDLIASTQTDPGGQPAVYKLTNDPRVTPVGRLLRQTSLDELPQLINVLRGQMSLVGPRPPIPYEFDAYDAWHRRRLLGVKPGITGLWQIKGRSRTTFHQMVRLDLKYAASWSLWLDLKILLQTPKAVISGEGAY